MKDAIGIEMAKANAIIMKKFVQEMICKNPKPTKKYSSNTTSSLVSGVENASPVVGRHPPVTWSKRVPSITIPSRDS